jgi:tRNA (mo5U34)-methyltransferase
MSIAANDLRREVERIEWFHNIDLGEGIVTPGRYDNQAMLRTIGMPESLAGKSVLDVGAWDGFYSFEAERRGAARVLATDHFCWSGEGWGTKEGFELARRARGSKVEDLEIDVLDLAPERVGGKFDVVLFLGVLYHMRHPLLALERVLSVTGDLLILETHVERLPMRRPFAAFYPGTELNDDPTSWWGPNIAAVEAMLRDAGFRQVDVPYRTPLHHTALRVGYRVARAGWRRVAKGRAFAPVATQARAVFHARP